jgi:hypothetical protein
MDSDELLFARGVLVRLAQAAEREPETAQRIRDLVKESGLLKVFGAGAALNPLELLEAGGVALLREALAPLPVAQLRQIVAANGYDPDRATARWRSPARFVELIVAQAVAQMEQRDRAILKAQYPGTVPDQPSPSGASWML